MKKAKLLAFLSAITLTSVSSVSLFTNAVALKNCNTPHGTFEDFVSQTFGEEAIVEFSKPGCLYLALLPDKIGAFCYGSPYLQIKLKNNSDVDLVKTVTENCTDKVKCIKNDDDTYIINKNNSWHVDYLNNKDNELETIIYPEIMEFLKENDDVVSIKKLYSFSYETTKDTVSHFGGWHIEIPDTTDFDYDKYSNFDVKHYESIGCLGLYPKSKTEAETEYYKELYEVYQNLTEDYGEENVNISYEISQDVLISNSTQTLSENLYTANITGDVNADGSVNISDVVAIGAYISNPEANPLNEQKIINGDVHNTGDGLTASDALMIQQYLAGIITEL